ncbi:hypothetical protein GW17_00005436, partial [Ensete ventricosum]
SSADRVRWIAYSLYQRVAAIFPRYITATFPCSVHRLEIPPEVVLSELRTLTAVRSPVVVNLDSRLGMGVVVVPSSASRSPFGSGLAIRQSPPLRRPFFFLAFKGGPGPKCSALVTPPEAVTQEPKKSPARAAKRSKRGKAVAVVAAPTTDACPRDPDYSEVAAALENIYKLSPADVSDGEESGRQTVVKDGSLGVDNVVRNRKKRVKRLGLEERISMRRRPKKEASTEARRGEGREFDEDVEILVREYSGSTNLDSLDWKRMKIPPVLSSAEHTWLFKLMQPMKAILQVKEGLHKDLNREPTDGELADAVNMCAPQLRRHIEVARAARNKLIKVRQGIQKAKLELSFELGRLPTEEEIVDRVGISLERYHEIMKASKPVVSLNARHVVTQEEFINGITDIDGVGGDNRRQPAVLRLALDDVLDSLKPKESLVIRQRYGLDGKGDRTLGEIAGNLNISREMVRKHELKALLKLKHPTRVDYLRRYV